MEKNYKKDFLDIFLNDFKYGARSKFIDFCEMSALSIQNSCLHSPELEKRFLDIQKKYPTDDYKTLIKAFSILVEALQSRYQDFLGVCYQEINANNKKLGQFFTPFHLSRLMSNVMFSQSDIDKTIYEEISEPCCGSGSTIIPLLELINKNYKNTDKFLIIADDLDITCVFMAYIQLSLYGANAVVSHKNTLTQENFLSLYTPCYILNFKNLKHRKKVKELLDIVAKNNYKFL